MKQKTSISWNAVLNVVLLLLAFFVVLPQLDQFSNTIDALKAADGALVLLAFVLGMATLLFASLSYILLEPKLAYRRTLMVQIASTFTNRLLPAGLGGLSLMVRYLHQEKIKLGKALSIAGLNNFLGLLGHMLLLAGAFGASREGLLAEFDVSLPIWWVLIAASIIGLVLIVLWSLNRSRKFIKKSYREARQQFATYRKRPRGLMGALSSTLVVSGLYISCFYVCTQAIGLSISIESCLVVYSIGVAVGSLTPTPGGLVGVEAGLLAGLLALGQPEGTALSAVLLFRLVTYWVPILPGYAMFRYLQHSKVI